MLKANIFAELEADSDRGPLPGDVMLREAVPAGDRLVAEAGDRAPCRLLLCSRADEDLVGGGAEGAWTQPANVVEDTTEAVCEDKANKVLAACDVTGAGAAGEGAGGGGGDVSGTLRDGYTTSHVKKKTLGIKTCERMQLLRARRTVFWTC